MFSGIVTVHQICTKYMGLIVKLKSYRLEVKIKLPIKFKCQRLITVKCFLSQMFNIFGVFNLNYANLDFSKAV